MNKNWISWRDIFIFICKAIALESERRTPNYEAALPRALLAYFDAWSPPKTEMISVSKENIGTELRKAREAKNLSIEGVANLANISPSYLWSIENGGNPSIKILDKLLEIYQMELILRNKRPLKGEANGR